MSVQTTSFTREVRMLVIQSQSSIKRVLVHERALGFSPTRGLTFVQVAEVLGGSSGTLHDLENRLLERQIVTHSDGVIRVVQGGLLRTWGWGNFFFVGDKRKGVSVAEIRFNPFHRWWEGCIHDLRSTRAWSEDDIFFVPNTVS